MTILAFFLFMFFAMIVISMLSVVGLRTYISISFGVQKERLFPNIPFYRYKVAKEVLKEMRNNGQHAPEVESKLNIIENWIQLNRIFVVFMIFAFIMWLIF